MDLRQIIRVRIEKQRRIGTPTEAKDCLRIDQRRISVPTIRTFGDTETIEITAYFVLR